MSELKIEDVIFSINKGNDLERELTKIITLYMEEHMPKVIRGFKILSIRCEQTHIIVLLEEDIGGAWSRPNTKRTGVTVDSIVEFCKS